MNERCVETPRGPVHYWVSEAPRVPGNRPWLFFLHGLSADHRLFDRQVEQFEGRFPLIVWDAPMHGNSRPYQGFSFATSAEDMAAVLDAQGVATCVLVGQSMGGYNAQHFIKRFPQRVSGFIGIDTASVDPAYYTRSDRWWLHQVGWMSHWYTYRGLVNGIVKASTATEYGSRNMTDMLQVYPKDELCNLLGTVYSALADELTDVPIDCPVQLVLGERDRIGKMQPYNHAWAEREGLTLRVIAGAGHNSNADAPDVVNAIIEEFCRML